MDDSCYIDIYMYIYNYIERERGFSIATILRLLEGMGQSFCLLKCLNNIVCVSH